MWGGRTDYVAWANGLCGVGERGGPFVLRHSKQNGGPTRSRRAGLSRGEGSFDKLRTNGNMGGGGTGLCSRRRGMRGGRRRAGGCVHQPVSDYLAPVSGLSVLLGFPPFSFDKLRTNGLSLIPPILPLRGPQGERGNGAGANGGGGWANGALFPQTGDVEGKATGWWLCPPARVCLLSLCPSGLSVLLPLRGPQGERGGGSLGLCPALSFRVPSALLRQAQDERRGVRRTDTGRWITSTSPCLTT